ncbi:patatin-like phospholipase family protein [Rhodoferax sp. 4810]|nr:patatin-like phospholipase family protein [Rhodoferax jenense]
MNRRGSLAALGCGAAAALGACSLGPCEEQGGQGSRGRPADPDTPSQVSTGQTYPVAWVLSSGGPRGFVHVGVLRALHELGLKPDLVLGSSVGALVGALYAAGMPMAQMTALALETSVSSLFRLNLSGPGWINVGGVADMVNDAAAGQRLQHFPTPFAATALAQESNTLTAFNWGNAGLAVQAACSIEGQLAPVRIRGQTFLDADRLSPMPVRLAKSLGAQRVLAVDASAYEDQAPPGAEAYRASDLRKRQLTEADARHADLVLHPAFGYYTGVSREYRERTIEAGYRQTLLQAQRLRHLHGLL